MSGSIDQQRVRCLGPGGLEVSGRYRSVTVKTLCGHPRGSSSALTLHLLIMPTDAFKTKLPDITAYDSDDDGDHVEPYQKNVKKTHSCEMCGVVFKTETYLQKTPRL